MIRRTRDLRPNRGRGRHLGPPRRRGLHLCGSLALAHDAGHTTRLLVVTRGEAGNEERAPDADLAAVRESEMVRAAEVIGLNEVTLLEGYPDGAVASEPPERLIEEILAWLGNRRPEVLVTFGAHGVTQDPDHAAVGSAARWAVERLARSGVAPTSTYVIAPGYGPGPNRYDLSPEEQGATHRIEITDVADGAWPRSRATPRRPIPRTPSPSSRRHRGRRSRSTRRSPASVPRSPAPPEVRHQPLLLGPAGIPATLVGYDDRSQPRQGGRGDDRAL